MFFEGQKNWIASLFPHLSQMSCSSFVATPEILACFFFLSPGRGKNSWSKTWVRLVSFGLSETFSNNPPQYNEIDSNLLLYSALCSPKWTQSTLIFPFFNKYSNFCS